MGTYDLHGALSKLDKETRNRLSEHGFSPERLERLAKTLAAGGDADARRDARNRVASVRAPAPGDIHDAPKSDDATALAAGRAALRAGQLAVCVIAGGNAAPVGGGLEALV